jgi:hypothetical protein
MGVSASKSESPQLSKFSPIRHWATGLPLTKQPKAVTTALARYAASHANAANNLIQSRMKNVEEANLKLANAQRRFNVDPSNSSMRNLETKQDALDLAQGRLNDQIISKPIAPGPLRRLPRKIPGQNPAPEPAREPAPPLSNVASSIRSSAVAPSASPSEAMPSVGGMRRNRSKSRSKKQKVRAARKAQKARKARKTQRRK